MVWEPYVLVLLGGYMVGMGAFSLWAEGYDRGNVLAAFIGLMLAIWGFTWQ